MLAISAERSGGTNSPAPSRRAAPVIRHGHDPSELTGITSIHTALLTLSPAFMNALKKVAPKPRRSKVPYVVALALLAVIAVLGADASTREFGIAKGRQIAARLHRAPAAKPVEAPAAVAQAAKPAVPAVINAALVVQQDEPAVAPVVVTGPPAKKSTKTAPAVRTNAKKPQPRSATRKAPQRHTAMLAAQISGVKTGDL